MKTVPFIATFIDSKSGLVSKRWEVFHNMHPQLVCEQDAVYFIRENARDYEEVPNMPR